VAVRHGVAQGLVPAELGAERGVGEVGVELACTVGAPHEADGEAPGVTTAAAAALSDLGVVTAVEAGELAALDKVEALGEEDLVAGGDFFGVGHVEGLAVEGEGGGAGAFVGVGAGFELDFEGGGAVGGGGEEGRGVFGDGCGAEGVHGEGEGAVDDALGCGPEFGAFAHGEEGGEEAVVDGDVGGGLAGGGGGGGGGLGAGGLSIVG